MNERERIEEHFARGRTFGQAIIAATDTPAQVYRLALNALDTADLPMVQADAGQLALLLGIVSVSSEWIIDSHKQSDPIANLLADRLRKSAAAQEGDYVAVILAELSMN